MIRTGGKPAQHNDCIRLINTAASSACAGVDTASCNWLKEMSSGFFSSDKAAFLILVSSAKTGSFYRKHFIIGRNPLTPVIVGSNGNLMFPAPGSYRKITILAGMDPLFPYGYFFLRSCVPPENLFSESLTHMGGRNHYALFWSVYDNVTEFVKSLSYFFESGKTVRWLVNTGESAAPNNQLILFTNSVQE